jgi:hypothetical protein
MKGLCVMPESESETRLREDLARRDDDRRQVHERLSRERLTRVTTEMVQTLTSPAFFDKVRDARDAADRGEGMEAAARLLSIESLRELGVDIPDDFRMTSRVFEDRENGGQVEFRDVPIFDPNDPGLVGWGGCAGGGGLTFCGCGGFST